MINSYTGKDYYMFVTEYEKWLKEYMDNIKQFQDDKNYDKLMKLMMIKMMDAQAESMKLFPNISQPTKLPIDPDGTIMALLKEIETCTAQLRKLIISRGRE